MTVILSAPFLLLSGSAAATGVLVNGVVTFGPKYFESKFYISAALATQFFGELISTRRFGRLPFFSSLKLFFCNFLYGLSV